jgi:hypothetical protein
MQKRTDYKLSLDRQAVVGLVPTLLLYKTNMPDNTRFIAL